MAQTFKYQHELPIMPVPDLYEVCQKLKNWSAPLLTKKEQQTTEKVIEHFLQKGGEGELLQNELTQWQKQNPNTNWAAPVWKALYLESRKPLVINSNVFYYLKNKLDEKICSQAHIASALIKSVYDFMQLIDNEELEADLQKDKALCMNQYKNIFSSMRVPRQGCDEFKTSTIRTHIIVMYKQRIFKLNMLDITGETRSIKAIELDLNNILNMKSVGQNLGVLTSMPRDQWASKRNDLLDISEDNKQAMKLMENATFALCLDDNQPELLTSVSEQLLYGNGKNRFFDKSLQLIVFKNGKMGINFEHTGVDGSVMLRLISHLYDSMEAAQHYKKDAEIKLTEDSIQEIKFKLNHSLEETISQAEIAFKLHVDETQTRVLDFSSFGKNQIKQFAVSPDAFVQLALQFAEYKLYGKLYSAYEAVMTRTFLDGRIDVLYTVSPESVDFIEKMQDDDCSVESKVNALVKATQKHSERAKECRSGEGIYSHLLALQYHYKQAGLQIGLENMPKIFTDKGFQTLTNSIVCTSTTSNYGVELAGYGPIVDDGYGIRYFTNNDSIRFNMTSRTELKKNLDEMKVYIEQSLLEMADLMLQR